MSGITFLQIFLYINVFIIGVVAAIAVRHAWAHFHPQQPKLVKPVVQTPHLSPEAKEQLIAKAQADFKRVLDHSAAELQADLEATATGLNKELAKLGNDVVISETERYQTMLEQLRAQAETVITTAQTEIKDHQTDLKAKLGENITAEQQRLVAQMDTKLADAISSFLTETLQHNVDLGAQMPYMLSMLDEHKAELIEGITHEG
jgi:F0F1-type ATP synthase membrane subunit b/b'